ncbi:hypothetical protein QBC33DRAFT_481372 [Phialemonium atrogriseum]|uniref:Uncharacterized protein n=1 Tax=Phialemonium atrogriseum TaxID=1093897 RepID=A0AAJ0BT16_9PEZI|nr:uncharacterized protein QBC33DRAFT_481372 [Phialemonium atrogriseum]KAK1762574.1 hypothetical protein QBC33DRAFT_481372 [Phialemonium atrogriseum]
MEGLVSRLRLAQQIKTIDRAQSEASKVPFLDNKWMDGPPSCSEADFKTPRLRQCAFDIATINWKSSACIDGGLDGYLWKVWFGEDGPYVLKVFWDAEPPDFRHYYAVQRECQNSALLQMIEAAVHQAAIESTPILVNGNPKTKDDAMANVCAFSHEGRQRQSSAGSSGVTAISSIPRMRKCYGWLRFSGQIFLKMPARLRAPTLHIDKVKRTMSADREYIAIVYEYVEEVENDPAVVEEVAAFFWLAGFSHTISPAARNWKSGVLVDLSDIVHPGGYGWHPKLYGPRKANRLLIP